jgi:hypothetical protein
VQLLSRKAQHLVLTGPFGRQVGEASNAHAVGEPTLDRRSDACPTAPRATLIVSLICGTAGYLAGSMMNAVKCADEVEDRQAAAIQDIAATRNSRNVIDFKERAMTIRVIRKIRNT